MTAKTGNYRGDYEAGGSVQRASFLQKFMYTANIVKIYRFECTLSKMKVHLERLCAFLIKS